MDVQLTRFAYYPDRTIGLLELGEHHWYTVERPWLDNAPNISCIPTGEYAMEKVTSPRFGPGTLEIMDVPGRTHILIHAANWSKQLEGCIAPGRGLFAHLEGVTNSKNALRELERLTGDVDRMSLVIADGALRIG
jgi:hypothetical protein|tara:strand:+ start:966 stop:1370 length:405 start_codon:yes stop_codon:yes gene_type:complete